VTLWLATAFRVIGVDISVSHLAIAERTMREEDCRNVELCIVDRVDVFERLQPFDCFLSFIVLQHNPPPVMRWLLLTILSKVTVGGIGLF